MKLDIEYYQNIEDVLECVKECEGKHIQQVTFSTYHNAFTQICFGCKKVRTNIRRQ